LGLRHATQKITNAQSEKSLYSKRQNNPEYVAESPGQSNVLQPKLKISTPHKLQGKSSLVTTPFPTQPDKNGKSPPATKSSLYVLPTATSQKPDCRMKRVLEVNDVQGEVQELPH
jgi:hypothetical protein